MGNTLEVVKYSFLIHFNWCSKVTPPAVWYIKFFFKPLTSYVHHNSYIHFLFWWKALAPLVEQIWYLGRCGLVIDLLNSTYQLRYLHWFILNLTQLALLLSFSVQVKIEMTCTTRLSNLKYPRCMIIVWKIKLDAAVK